MDNGDNNSRRILMLVGVILVSLTLVLGYIWYQGGKPEVNEKDEAIKAYVESLSTSNFKGAILVAKSDTIIASNAVGLADREHEIPNTLDTQFNLGSMNKMFTAVAIMQLVEEERIDVNKTVGYYVPDYPNLDVSEKVTVHHLLTHTSGLGDVFYQIYYEDSWNNHSSVIEYLPLFVDDPLLFEPGSEFSYSNAGFIVLGLIIEEVTGQSYFDYITENIFTPCDMTYSTYLESEREEAKVAIGYTASGTDNTNQRLLNGCPAGGGYSTVNDLYNFSRALLRGDLMRQETLGVLFKPRVHMIEISEEEFYCYGIMSSGVGENRMLGHGGGATGVHTGCYFFPELDYYLIILSNTDYGITTPLHDLRVIITN